MKSLSPRTPGSVYIPSGGEPVAYRLARCIVTGESAAGAGRTVQARESLDARERRGDRGHIVNKRCGASARELTGIDIVSDVQGWSAACTSLTPPP